MGKYANHDYITQIRGYSRFHPADSDRLVAMLDLLALDLDVLNRPEEKHSITGSVSRDLRDHLHYVAGIFRVTPSELIRFSVLSTLHALSDIPGVPDVPEEAI
jgi:hypothetical protein